MESARRRLSFRVPVLLTCTRWFRTAKVVAVKRGGGAAKRHSLAPSGEGYAERKCKGGERKLTDAHRGWGKRCTFPITWRGDGVGNGESGCAGNADRQAWGHCEGESG